PHVDAGPLGVDRPVDGGHQRGDVAALGVAGPQAHERHLPVHPGDTRAVVAPGTDDPGDVGAVLAGVLRIAVAGHGVVAVGAGRAAADAPRVRPEVGHQVGMGQIDAAVHDADDDVGRPGGGRPGGFGVHVGA